MPTAALGERVVPAAVECAARSVLTDADPSARRAVGRAAGHPHPLLAKFYRYFALASLLSRVRDNLEFGGPLQSRREMPQPVRETLIEAILWGRRMKLS